MNRIDFKTGFGYAFIHFSMEVLCFFFLYRVFGGTGWWWTIALVYDTVAFAGQVPVGAFCEKHPRFSPGVCGAVLLVTGALTGLAATGCLRPGAGNISAVAEGATIGTLAAVAAGAGFVILSIGNAFLHISGALITLKVSQGRLGETGIFVGGGAFGVVTGRLLGSGNGPVWIPFVLMAVSFVLIILLDRVQGIQLSGDVQEPALIPSDAARDDGIFTDRSRLICVHDHAANRPAEVIILVLAGVIAVRSYISNGIPMQWKKTVFETIMLYVSMG
ncbi:MAG: hypothetical protein K6E62_06970, partial [Lachnospiraceae bacterium]|nr:hypothetical protein [Lachnospiraceae bacterium]